jgi:hypothetical protein
MRRLLGAISQTLDAEERVAAHGALFTGEQGMFVEQAREHILERALGRAAVSGSRSSGHRHPTHR